MNVAGCHWNAKKYATNQGVVGSIPASRTNMERIVDSSTILFHVRPAWAHSWRCKSSRKLTTASEVKRNCMRATDCGKEARSVNHEPMNKNQIEGGVDQGERACNRKAFVVKDQAA